jgi:exopolysaccharide biosynthesis polyprenyl glycosylphosphotransferase
MALALSFVLAFLIDGAAVDHVAPGPAGLVLVVLSIPVWVVLARTLGLYDRDEGLADHSTVDDLPRVFYLATAVSWFLLLGAWVIDLGDWSVPRVASFWLLSVFLVTVARTTARTVWRRSDAYRQRTLIVGSGQVGQLVARKILKHPEYGLELVGFVDNEPRARGSELATTRPLGSLVDLRELVQRHGIRRVVVGFTGSGGETLEAIRSLNDLDVQIDVVPRLFELFTPTVSVHMLEAFPLVGLPPPRLSPSSRLLKRVLDVAGVIVGLVLAAPVLGYIAVRIKRDSPGPILYRQVRVGKDMREFTVFKFRTMRVGTDADEHRRYIARVMEAGAPEANGLFKLDRDAAVTRSGRWLRRTSLDELPQLFNVLRGDMSLVGPRPCLPYETEHFQPHHYERFHVRPGITGLWQVSARANSTFGEALDMDVAYTRGWSFGLDLRLLLRTPVAVVRQRAATV